MSSDLAWRLPWRRALTKDRAGTGGQLSDLACVSLTSDARYASSAS